VDQLKYYEGMGSLTYTEIEVSIEELEGALLIHGTQAEYMPFVADARPS